MEVFVTGRTGLRDSQKRLVQIFGFDCLLIRGRDALRHVALVACESGVLAFELVSRLGVIKNFGSRIPLGRLKVQPIMFGVAAGAIL